jgi:hypothetical protein
MGCLKTHHKKGLMEWHSEGPELKPQYHEKEKKRKEIYHK